MKDILHYLTEHHVLRHLCKKVNATEKANQSFRFQAQVL